MCTETVDPASASPAVRPQALVVSNVSMTLHGRRVLHDVSLRVACGEIHGLFGANGSGKTSLLRVIAGVWQADRGTVAHLYGGSQQLGYCAQSFGLYDELTVEENLGFHAQMLGCGLGDVESVCSQFRLGELLPLRAGRLSGGQRQRLTLALALINRPALLLLDEPTTALDAQMRLYLWDVLDAEAARGTAIILTTHERQDVAACHAFTHLTEGVVRAESP